MGSGIRKHKQTIFALLFAVALVGISYAFASTKSASLTQGTAITKEQQELQKNKDTDGDGISDWDENEQGTNPLVPEGGAYFATSTGGVAGAFDDVPDNATTRFSQNFLADYLTRSADGSLTEEAKAEFLQKAVAEATVNAKDVLFMRGDIRISTDEDPATIHTYGNTIGRIMTQEVVANDNELFIVQRALQTDSPEMLEALDPLVAAYKHMIENTRATVVPAPLINEHLALLNALLALHNDIVAMRNIFEDGLPGVVRVRRYDSDVEALYSALVALRVGLESRGAVYQETDAGAFFAQFQ